MSVALTASAQTKENTLVLAYRVQNDTASTIYLTNQISRWHANGLTFDPSYVYTIVDGGVLRLTQAQLSIPDGVKVEDPAVPYLTPVNAGEQFASEIQLPLPLRPSAPYGLARFSNNLNRFQQITLVIGWVSAKIQPRSIEFGGRTLWKSDYGKIEMDQQLLETTLEASIPTHIA